MDADYWNRELETRPWHKVELWQVAHIVRFIEALRTRSEFYRTRLKANARPLRSFAALQQFGLTSEHDVQAAQTYTPDWIPLGSLQTIDTVDIIQVVLGSAGTQTQGALFALTQRDLEVWIDAIANTLFTGGVRADHVIAHWPLEAGAGLPYADALRRIGAMLVPLGGLANQQALALLHRTRADGLLAPESLCPTGSPLSAQLRECNLAMHLRYADRADERHAPRQSDAEMRPDAQRRLMGVAGVMPGMWSECAAGGGMHFNAQRYVAVELIDPASGAQIAWREGARGEAVYTTFEREATPLLRYRSGDYLVVTGLGCACGRTAPKVEYLGRSAALPLWRERAGLSDGPRDAVLAR